MYFLQASQKRFLSNFNSVFVVFVIFGTIVLRTIGFELLPAMFKDVDVLLPFVVYFGQRRSMAEGLTLTIITSHFFSLCSSAPIGVFVLLYLILFIVAQGVSYVVYADRWPSIMALIFVLSLIHRVISVPVVALFDQSWGGFWDWGLFLGPLGNALLGYVFFRMISGIDRATQKTPATNIQFAESEI